jgi:hypothetical protein
VSFWNNVSDNSIRRKFETNSLARTLVLCTEF